MDHHHHPSSSTTTKEEDDLSHGDKRAKTNDPSSTSATNHNADTLPLPQLPHLHLCFLPDIAHDAIASYLTMKNMHCMMESSLWLLKAYGGRVKDLRLPQTEVEDDNGEDEGDDGEEEEEDHKDDDCNGHEEPIMALALSVISQRTGLLKITMTRDETMGAVAEAMRKGYCDKLERLEIVSDGRIESNPELIHALCDALADGLCPKINALMVPDIDDLVPSMGKALQSRMGKGCCGLKSLEIKGRISSLSSLLSSGACEALEELKLDEMEAKVKEDLSEWLLRTKAAHLRTFASLWTDIHVAQALSPLGVAPRLQVLELHIRDDLSSLPFLSHAIGAGAWPHLRELTALIFGSTVTVPSLVEAIGVGAVELTTLHGSGFGPEGGMAVARMLRDGGCPQLEELGLSDSWMGDDAVVELARALEGGAPCSTTLRRLNLGCCGITSLGMRGLMESMGRGAAPSLERLKLSSSRRIMDDGVMAIAEAVSGGSLWCLQELDLCHVGLRGRGAKALFQALRGQNTCPHLTKLDVGSNKIGDNGVLHLAKAIKAGALQHLQELVLRHVDIGEKGFNSLIKAIVAQQPNPGCPRLEVLNVQDNYRIATGGLMYLAEMMKVEGAMQHLREINLRTVCGSMDAIVDLFQSLGDSRVCPALQTLLGFNNRHPDVRHLMEEMNATRGRSCQVKVKLY